MACGVKAETHVASHVGKSRFLQLKNVSWEQISQKKIKTKTTKDPTIPLLGIYSKKQKH